MRTIRFLLITLLAVTVSVILTGEHCFYAQDTEGESGAQPQIMEESYEQPTGYLEEGTAIYGVEENAVDDYSPLMELKMLRKKYFREVQRRESLEEAKSMLERRLFEMDGLLKRKDYEIDGFKRKTASLEFKYVALEQRLMNLKLAILRKKLIRESQYSPLYEVKKNDSLWRIAGRKDIYDNNMKWTELFYANQDKIADPDYIYPGMIIKVPRPELAYEDWTVKGLDLESVKQRFKELYQNAKKLDLPADDILNEIYDDSNVPANHRLEQE